MYLLLISIITVAWRTSLCVAFRQSLVNNGRRWLGVPVQLFVWTCCWWLVNGLWIFRWNVRIFHVSTRCFCRWIFLSHDGQQNPDGECKVKKQRKAEEDTENNDVSAVAFLTHRITWRTFYRERREQELIRNEVLDFAIISLKYSSEWILHLDVIMIALAYFVWFIDDIKESFFTKQLILYIQ